MGRVALACLAIAATVLAGGPALAGASIPAPPRSELQGFACHQSSDSLNRWIEVTGVMRPVAGTQRMAMKFQLLRKESNGHSWIYVSGRGLGTWVHPTNPPTLGQRPGDHWSLQKPVVNLAAPAIYRLRVSFRWTGSAGHVLGTVARLSEPCDQH
jgi:hypothetical protein